MWEGLVLTIEEVDYVGGASANNSYTAPRGRGAPGRGRYPRVFRGTQNGRGNAQNNVQNFQKNSPAVVNQQSYPDQQNYPVQQSYPVQQNYPVQQDYPIQQYSGQQNFQAPQGYSNLGGAPPPQNFSQRGALRFQNNYRQPYRQPNQYQANSNFRQPNQTQNFGANPTNDQIFQCTSCGYSHSKGQCWAYGQTCHACGKLNHFLRCCRSNPSS